MGITDKFEHGAEELEGKAKEAFGKLTDDEETEAEGKAEQVVANVKQAGDDLGDAVK